MRSCKAARFALLLGIELLGVGLLGGCRREARETQDAPLPFSQKDLATTSTVMAGGGAPAAPDPRITHFEKNAWHISEGERLYHQYNCVECHANGGGGIGVPLMDDEWIYGSSSPQIVATLIQGRPNGMPSFRNLLTEEQMWQLAAYVRTLSAHTPKDARPSRSDTLSGGPPPTLQDEPPVHDTDTESGSR